jgi:uncharacterized protein DUF4440
MTTPPTLLEFGTRYTAAGVLTDVAVATGRTRGSGNYQGQDVSVALRFTDVFHLRNGSWQIVASQGTMIAP